MRTIPGETVNCSECGKIGQRKWRRHGDMWYEYFDHYGIRDFTYHHYTYRSSCYVGKVVDSAVALVLDLHALNNSSSKAIIAI